MSYITLRALPFPHKKNTFSYSFHTFAHIRQHYFSEYWGTNAWAVPHLKLWGTVPPVPPRSPPLYISLQNEWTMAKMQFYTVECSRKYTCLCPGVSEWWCLLLLVSKVLIIKMTYSLFICYQWHSYYSSTVYLFIIKGRYLASLKNFLHALIICLVDCLCIMYALLKIMS